MQPIALQVGRVFSGMLSGILSGILVAYSVAYSVAYPVAYSSHNRNLIKKHVTYRRHIALRKY